MMNNKIIPSVHSKEPYFSPGNTAEAARIESRDRKEEFGYIFESIQDKKQADDEAKKIAEKKAKEDEMEKASSEKSNRKSERLTETAGQAEAADSQGEKAKDGEDKRGIVSEERKAGEAKLTGPDAENAQAGKTAGEAEAGSDNIDKLSAASEKKTDAADGRVEQKAEKLPAGESEMKGEKSASSEGSGEGKQQAQPVTGQASTDGKQAGDLVHHTETKTVSSAEANEAGRAEEKNSGRREPRIAAERAAGPVAARNAASEQVPSNRPAALDSRKGPSFLGANMANQADKETGEDVNKLIYSLFGKQETAESLEKSVEIRGIKAEQIREKRNQKHLASFARRSTFTAGTNGGVNGEGSSSSSTKPETLNSFSQMVLPTSGSSAEELMSSDKDLMWKEHTMEISESKENNNTFQTSGFTRLEQMPVSNISIRRNVLPGLTQTVLKAADGGKSSPESWQKHNFVMDDGKNVQLSTRKIDGVLHVKLSSSFQELNRLLQQYSDEIREHLEKECDLKIDLQFDGQEEGNLSEFFGDSSQPRGRSSSHTKNPGAKTSPGQIEKVLPKSVRKFGYNQMEWTA